jgi:hypothetical protein
MAFLAFEMLLTASMLLPDTISTTCNLVLTTNLNVALGNNTVA